MENLCWPCGVQASLAECQHSASRRQVQLLKKLQGTQHACRYIASGCSDGYNYMVMELLADSLSSMFRKYRQNRSALDAGPVRGCGPGGGEPEEPRFAEMGLTLTQAAFLGRQAIRALEGV